MLHTSKTPIKNNSERKIQIAYLILVHRLPAQFKRLFHALYDENNYYLIHVDKRSGDLLNEEIESFLKGFKNVFFLESQAVFWGGYSIVNVELRGMEKLLEISENWDFFINLSGQDFPLFSQEYISEYLSGYRESNFMQISEQQLTRPETMNRIENSFCETSEGFTGKPYTRPYMEGITPYIGGQWMILSRAGVHFLTQSPEGDKFKKYYQNTLIPDESFFQTLLMNSSFAGEIIPDDKRAILWIPEFGPELKSQIFTASETTKLIQSGQIKLRPKTLSILDLEYLTTIDALFARKFDETIDSEILDVLEKKILQNKSITKE